MPKHHDPYYVMQSAALQLCAALQPHRRYICVGLLLIPSVAQTPPVYDDVSGPVGPVSDVSLASAGWQQAHWQRLERLVNAVLNRLPCPASHWVRTSVH